MGGRPLLGTSSAALALGVLVRPAFHATGPVSVAGVVGHARSVPLALPSAAGLPR